MRKLGTGLLACVVLAGTALASPVGWIHPEAGRFGVGGEVGAITNRDLEWNSGNNVAEIDQSVYYVGRIGYGLTDQVEIYGRLGGADLDLRSTVGGLGWTGTAGGSTEFAWGVGLQGVIYDAGTWNLAGDANYFAHNSHTLNSIGVNDADFWEWQVGLQAQTQFDQFYPYLGVKYSDANIQYTNLSPDLEADDNVGVYVGAGFNLSGNWSGYLEGRFVDETSFGGGVQYRF
ncbi:MAG: hypothetical protein D6679_01700 [Candidatus Hydrogenedentota bacterium]|nr:MAG: hypothetical protein D6679_01700 [Candidatus Hydrogenedentota bacterium]